MKGSIKVVLAMQNQEARTHFQSLLKSLIAQFNSKGVFPRTSIRELNESALTPEQVFQKVDEILHEEACMVVLIADWLVEERPLPQPAVVTLRGLEKLRSQLFGIIAVMGTPYRVADIDRTVPSNANESVLMAALDLVFHRLDYLKPPEAPLVLDLGKLTIRLLRKGNLTEFKDYFALRHRIYAIMGYLEEEVETCPSHLEMNEADTHAIHIGAFYRVGFREMLIGCARVVMNTPEDKDLREMCERLAGADPIIARRLDRADPLNLPIFQTHSGMNKIMPQIYRNNVTCGELSRLVVDRNYRGSGLSRLLVQEGMNQASSLSVSRMFLECLEIHETMYQKLGFVKLDGMKARVVTVARTMIAMELDPNLGVLRQSGRRSLTIPDMPQLEVSQAVTPANLDHNRASL